MVAYAKIPIITEEALHIQIASYLTFVLDKRYTLWTTVENSNQQGGKQGIIKQGKLRKKGVLKGFPDIVIFYKSDKNFNFQCLMLEVKRPKGGVLSASQKEVHAQVTKIGGDVVVVKSVEDVIEILVECGVPLIGCKDS